MKIGGQTIGEYFETRGMTIVIGHPSYSPLAAWVRHYHYGQLAFGWLKDQPPSRGWLIRLQRIAVVKHARLERRDAEFSAAKSEKEKEETEVHTVSKPLPSMRRVRRIAAPISPHEKYKLNEAQFGALVKVMGLNTKKNTTRAIEKHLVAGLSMPDAAKQAGMEYQRAGEAIRRAKNKIDLCRQVCEISQT